MSEALGAQQPEEIINRVRPEHQSVQRFEGGDNRDIFVIDDAEAFRFPKNESGVEANHYEFEALKIVYGKLSVAVPRPIELAADGSYNVLEFLRGNVLRKHEVAELPYEKRRNLGVAIAGVINELNDVVTVDELQAVQPERSLVRNRDEYYAGVYETVRLAGVVWRNSEVAPGHARSARRTSVVGRMTALLATRTHLATPVRKAWPIRPS